MIIERSLSPHVQGVVQQFLVIKYVVVVAVLTMK
jgi:hypothetical protein